MTARIRTPKQLVTVHSTEAAKRRVRRAMAKGKLPKQRVDGTFKVSMRGKYQAKGRWIGTQWFASRAEADRYEQLSELAANGTIDQLELQVPYPCRVNGQLVCTYLADFRYRINPGRLGQRVLVEEVKGFITRDYAIKRKLVHALYPIEIIELTVPKRGNVSRYRWLTADQFHTAPEEKA